MASVSKFSFTVKSQLLVVNFDHEIQRVDFEFELRLGLPKNTYWPNNNHLNFTFLSFVVF